MSIYIHDLQGCATVPIAYYLKALGILRLVSEQKDARTRGWWENGSFRLATRLSRDELVDFFMEEYAPTPILDPWNGGSGFYPRDNMEGIHALEKSEVSRFQLYRDTIRISREIVGNLSESPKKEPKNQMIAACRRSWPQKAQDWLDAAISITGNGDPAYPSLFGTGGNDVRLDFTNNFMKNLNKLLIHPDTDVNHLLRIALFDAAAPKLQDMAIGQFNPGHTGGPNAANGYEGKTSANLWDYILMLEGAVAFVSGVSRRASATALPRAAAPFAVHPTSVGFGSASSEETKSRGEQWMPIWNRPLIFSELRRMIAEGRSQLGKRASERPLDFSRAIARYGVARGIAAFERYGYLERNGQAHLAVPLGRWQVRPQPNQELLDDVAVWIDSCRRSASSLSASFQSIQRICEEAAMKCTTNGASPRVWTKLLETMADMELKIVTATRSAAEKNLRPIPRLHPEWLQTANDETVEYRLGIALGSIHGIRKFLLPLNKNYRLDFTNTLNWVCRTGNLRRDIIGLIRRVAVLSEQSDSGTRRFILTGDAPVAFSDIHALIDGRVDETRVMKIGRALAAIDWKQIRNRGVFPATPDYESPDSLYALFKLAHLPFSLGDISVRYDASILERLLAGDLPAAFCVANRRLRVAGLFPKISIVAGDDRLARRIALAIAFPVSPQAANRLANRICKPYLPAPEEAGETLPEDAGPSEIVESVVE